MVIGNIQIFSSTSWSPFKVACGHSISQRAATFVMLTTDRHPWCWLKAFFRANETAYLNLLQRKGYHINLPIWEVLVSHLHAISNSWLCKTCGAGKMQQDNTKCKDRNCQKVWSNKAELSVTNFSAIQRNQWQVLLIKYCTYCSHRTHATSSPVERQSSIREEPCSVKLFKSSPLNYIKMSRVRYAAPSNFISWCRQVFIFITSKKLATPTCFGRLLRPSSGCTISKVQ
jgi:hypothetical protein